MESRIAFKRIHCKVLTTLPDETVRDSTEMRFLEIKVAIKNSSSIKSVSFTLPCPSL